MMQICFRSCLAGLLLATLSGTSPAQSRAPQHPLEALTFQEYWAVRDVLQASGKIDEHTFIPGVLLHEPPKDRVLAWKPGDPVFRVADMILLRKGLTIEARVDIAVMPVMWHDVLIRPYDFYPANPALDLPKSQ